MSVLNTYLETEHQLKQLQEKLKQLESNESFQKELSFKNKLEALIKEYDKSAADVIALLNPQGKAKAAAKSAASGGTPKKRKLKIYKNPTTGEVVETRGGNHKTLKAWKEEHGAEVVESWLVREED